MTPAPAQLVPEIPLDRWAEGAVDALTDRFPGLFAALETGLGFFTDALEALLTGPPQVVVIAALAAVSWLLAGWRVAAFTAAGALFIVSLGLWGDAMLTLSLVLASASVALLIGVPIGILAARLPVVRAVVHPVLDVMQTMPAFVYLIPMVLLLGLGNVPTLIATVVFAMPPAVRLTMLGIQGVPGATVEAAAAFGATPWQTLRKVELPLALPTIMAGVNQVIMLALSMVVVAALIGAGGLGAVVVGGLSQMDVGQGFVGGAAIVVIAMILDRTTRDIGRRPAPAGRPSRLDLRGRAARLLPGRGVVPAPAEAELREQLGA